MRGGVADCAICPRILPRRSTFARRFPRAPRTPVGISPLALIARHTKADEMSSFSTLSSAFSLLLQRLVSFFRSVLALLTDRTEQLSLSAVRADSLHSLRSFHSQSIKQVFFLSPYLLLELGKLILGSASRLDAFSASPFWT